jgi:hypothetical protein
VQAYQRQPLYRRLDSAPKVRLMRFAKRRDTQIKKPAAGECGGFC